MVIPKKTYWWIGIYFRPNGDRRLRSRSRLTIERSPITHALVIIFIVFNENFRVSEQKAIDDFKTDIDIVDQMSKIRLRCRNWAVKNRRATPGIDHPTQDHTESPLGGTDTDKKNQQPPACLCLIESWPSSGGKI